MYDLTVIKLNGGAYVDSREVAGVIGKRHHNLLRDINGYIGHMANSDAIRIDCVDFFLESSYLDEKGETRPCYLISKMGCELVANKLTGEKGVLFTAAYVSKFNEMAQRERERAELEARASMPRPRLGEYNACARVVVNALENAGAEWDRIIVFLKGLYEPLGICVAEEDEFYDPPQTYSAKQIAKMHGVYSKNGNPHYWAAAAILNENLFIGDKHKTSVTVDFGGRAGVCIRYDEYAAQAAWDWIVENGFPDKIRGFGRTFHVNYQYDAGE